MAMSAFVDALPGSNLSAGINTRTRTGLKVPARFSFGEVAQAEQRTDKAQVGGVNPPFAYPSSGESPHSLLRGDEYQFHIWP